MSTFPKSVSYPPIVIPFSLQPYIKLFLTVIFPTLLFVFSSAPISIPPWLLYITLFSNNISLAPSAYNPYDVAYGELQLDITLPLATQFLGWSKLELEQYPKLPQKSIPIFPLLSSL